MADLKLIPLHEIFSDAQVKKLSRKLTDLGARLPEGSEDAVELEEALSDDHLADFMDRLEAHEVACDIYLPVEFDGRADLGEGMKVGSAFALVDALEELREELAMEDEEAEDDDDIDEDAGEDRLIHAWQVFSKVANACIEQRLPLQVIP